MTITIYCFRVYCCPHLHLGLFLVSLLKNHQLENFRLAIVDLSSICFDFGLFSKNFLAPSVTFKFSRTKVITSALLSHVVYVTALTTTFSTCRCPLAHSISPRKLANKFCHTHLVNCVSLLGFEPTPIGQLVKGEENEARKAGGILP